ncbi:MAG: AMP-binding protein [Cyclobacteriaceae bacterium]|nr:AMP-binding protein [Cyclobacteriaceae bacterium]
MEKLKINGKIIDPEALVSDEWKWVGLSETERKPLQIIRDWQHGQTEFTFQTSGSTGTPKQCSFSRSQILASAQRTLDFFQLYQGNAVLCCLNTEFVAGFMMIIRALVGQLNLIITDPSTDPWKSLEDRIDFAAVTPMQIENGIRNHPEKIAKVGTILIGGAAIHPLLEKQLQALPGRVYHSYAMTETLTHVALREVVGPGKSDLYTALPGVSFTVDDRNCLIIHDDLLGIIELITNDIAELPDSKSFRWLGRFDHVINTGGIKIQVEQLEIMIGDALLQHGISANFCAVATADIQLTNRVVLLMETHGAALGAEEIRMLLKTRMPRYHCPSEVIFVSKIFHTKSGKVDRIKNASHYLHT